MELVCPSRSKKYNSYKGPEGETAPNLIERNFQAEKPLEKCTTDISEFKVLGKKLYLSPALDMFNGEILSYSIGESPSKQLVLDMLELAFPSDSPYTQLTFHSDQGWQYRTPHYRRDLAKRGITQSMSRKGNCLDNAMMESFFGTLKSEFFYLKTFDSVDQFLTELDEYIRYYNDERIKTRLGTSPVQYRLLHSA